MTEKKQSKKRMIFLILVVSLFFVLFLNLDSVDAYRRSNPAYTNYYSGFGSGTPYAGYEDRCESGQDFVIQIAPFGCEPAIVRSDLLEEQNVPVFCQLSASKLNPLIDVNAIESISFQGDYPKGVSGVGFHPAKAALGVEENLNSPLLENIGYAVIVLGKEEVEDNMPDYVKGNLTARIRYDIEDAFGVGRSSFYLPEKEEREWEQEKNFYSFWNGRAYLRAESVDNYGARVSVYDDTRKFGSFELEKGNVSRMMTIPSMDCLARFQLKLEDLVNPDTRARLFINGDVAFVGVGEKFLKNKCVLRDIEKYGVYQEVEISCSEDEERSVFELIQSPGVKIIIDGEEKTVTLGERIEELSSGENGVYVGYIGTVQETNGKRIFDTFRKEDLIVYFYEKRSSEEKLDNSEIKSIAQNVDSELRIRSFSDIFNLKNYQGVKQGTSKNINGRNIGVVDFAEPVDFGLSSYAEERNADYQEAKEYYDSAKADFQKVEESFPSEKSRELSTEDKKVVFGEEAFVEQIRLENDIGNRRSAKELCDKFSERYPDSSLYTGEIKSICEEGYLMANSEISQRIVFIDNNVERIRLDRIKEPTLDEYSVKIIVRKPGSDTQQYTLGKDQKITLNESSGDYIQLKSIRNSTAATFSVNLESSSEEDADVNGDKTLNKNSQNSFGSVYNFALVEVNTEKIAKVSVIPTIDNQYTEANFSFQVSIEKRGIKLSTEKTKEKIDTLNDSIEDWSDKSEKLGNVVEGLKASCLGLGAFLTISNFLDGIDGEAIARKNVMRDKGGWNDKCNELVQKGEYVSNLDCFNKNSDEIDKEVEDYKRIMNQQNLEEYEEGAEIETPFLRSLFGEKTIDDRKYVENYAPDAKETIKNSGITNIKCEGDVEISSEEIESYLTYNNWDNGSYSLSMLRDLDFYSRVYNEDSDDERAKNKICEIYGDIQSNSREILENQQQTEEMKENPALRDIGFSSFRDENTITLPYKDGKIGGEGLGDIKPGERVHRVDNYYVTINDRLSPRGYYSVKDIYDKDGNLLENDDLRPEEKAWKIKNNVIFEKSDAIGYNYKYESSNSDPQEPIARFYEREPYEGMPAIVPFDLDNGWYASIKQTLPGLGNIQSYDKSGRVSSFYICNVFENNREDNMKGDDKCHMINLGTGQPYDMSGFDREEDAKRLVQDAVNAIEQATRQRQDNPNLRTVKIDTRRGTYYIKVGEPQADIPDVQCQDFMSPKECQLLFNVCDPVVCPSSRCDFGGSYPVRDVIQSGIAGSIFLCLPNIQEGIYIPVCLTGIKAGIDGYLSILESHRDCLQESLDSGKMVGVCDEIYSIHLCDFFWRQTLPLAEMIVPKMFEVATGNNARGGGEYMKVQESWDSASQSVDYFTDYYSSDSFDSFKTRTTEAIKESVCKNYVSAVYPDEGDLADSLINPDSPPQFHGRFDQTTFTTTTNPPTSHYKVYYHIYAGKDSRAYYQVYLKGDESSFYRDTSSRRNVAYGYIPKGEYASETIDFTAPSGYKQLCINVNGQEECNFKEVSTSFAANYIQDKYQQEQAGQTDIKTESECVSGRASPYSAMNINPAGIGDDIVDPAIYERGLIRICASENPGKSSDGNYRGEGQRWIDVGYCGDPELRCWLDTQSVEDSIDFENLENETLSDLTNRSLDLLRKEGDYPTRKEIDSKIKELEGLEPLEKIKEINSFIDDVFWNDQKARVLMERGKAYADLLRNLLGKMKKETFEKIISEEELKDDSDDSSDDSDSGEDDNGNQEEFSCREVTCGWSASTGNQINIMGGEKCLKEVGEEVIKITEEVKGDNSDIDFSKVEEDTEAKTFECLVLQLAIQESCLSHCLYKQGENPLYCDGDSGSVIKGDDENSIGIMQINTNVHEGNFADFEENVKYGANLLASLYSRHGTDSEGNTRSRQYTCNGEVYSGWELALRYYNGWSPNDCTKGDPDYVENINFRSGKANQLFPDLC